MDEKLCPLMLMGKPCTSRCAWSVMSSDDDEPVCAVEMAATSLWRMGFQLDTEESMLQVNLRRIGDILMD